MTCEINLECVELRSNRLQIFFKISVLRNFGIFTGKYLYWSLFLIKFINERLKKRLQRLQQKYNIYFNLFEASHEWSMVVQM